MNTLQIIKHNYKKYTTIMEMYEEIADVLYLCRNLIEEKAKESHYFEKNSM